MLGETLTVQVRVVLAPGARLEPVLIETTTQAFLVNGTKILESKEEGGLRLEAYAAEVTPLALGEVPIRLSWTYSAGGSSRTVESPEIKVQVQEPPLDAGGEIRDIREPLRARPSLWPWLAAALLAGAGYWAWKRYSKKTVPAAEAPQDNRPPHVIAEQTLRELGASGLWEEGRSIEYYVRLTDALRRYLEMGLGIAALKMTTGELVRRLRDASVDRRLSNLLRGVFDRADLAKFARTPPGVEQGPLDLTAGLEFVRETSPRDLKEAVR